MTIADLSVKTVIFAFCVAGFTLLTAWTDLRKRKIYNKVTAPMWLAGWLYQAAFYGWQGIQIGVAGFACGFGILFAMWMFGAAGGGDVKLMGALGVWLGADSILKVALISLAIVAVVMCARTICGVVSRKHRPDGEMADGPEVNRHRKQSMGYAAPVAAATWGFLLWSHT